MKTLFRITVSAALGAIALLSCQNNRTAVIDTTQYPIKVDREVIKDVPANNPGTEVVVVTTDAPYWILTAPNWITPDMTHGVGGGKSIIVSLDIASNYKNESTTTKPRSGVVKISGGMSFVEIAVNQLGHEAVIDPSASIGGIPDLNEFQDFINTVNDGGNPVRWTNAAGEIELLADLDISDMDWVPIGNPDKAGNTGTASAPTGERFTGVFNGGGHTISGFKATETIDDGKTWGLFGYIENATIKNLNVVADVTLTAAKTADAGIVVGTMKCSTVENVTVQGKLDLKGTNVDNVRFAVGGIAGFAFSDQIDGVDYDSFIKDCSVDLVVTAVSGANTKNGASGCQYGGIVGFSTNENKDPSHVHVENCVNRGSITASIGRSAGIAGAANYGTVITGCTNYANHVSTMNNGRIANIACILGGQSSITDCLNYGSLTTTVNNCQSGAFVALLNAADVTVKGGGNYGDVISAFDPSTDGDKKRSFRGLLVANFSNFAEVSGMVVSGRLGKYVADSEPEWIEVTAENFISGKYIGQYEDANLAKIKSLTYVAPSAP